MNQLWIIYKAAHRDGRAYVGATVSGLSNRRSTHFSAARRGSTTPFHTALRQEPDGWQWEILATAFTQGDADTMERSYITKIKPSLNVRTGGNGGGKWPTHLRHMCRSKNPRTCSPQLREWFSEFHSTRNRTRKHDRGKMLQLHKEGKRISQIAHILGCNQALVSRVINGEYKH